VLGQWLAAVSPDVPQVLVDPASRWADPDRTAGDVVAADPTALADAVLAELGDGEAVGSEWVERWVEVEGAAQGALDHELSASGPLAMSEPAVARAVAAGLRDDGVLLASSSMPVRDVEWYAGPRYGSTVLSNRGANGIDGVISTAVGAAIGCQSPVIALVGDLAFLYDTAGLLAARSNAAAAVTVMVVDNDGGGIFSFLSQAQELPVALFERYWGTPHGLDLGAVAAAYGAHVRFLDCRDELEELVEGAGAPGLRVGIVRSTRPHNVAVHDQLHQAVANAVCALL
jgi:2-succinyl-5-enolpyruvyl-6-hydroxy-3-cyclohexene-1-carboxylate synthase